MKRTIRDRVCSVCGKVFSPTAPNARTCSAQCAAELNRRQCRDRYREAVLLTPYVIPNERGGENSAEPPKQPVSSATERTPEPSSPDEEARQKESVRETMALPAEQRYAFSRRWSDFQRREAVRIEKARLSEDSFLSASDNSLACSDRRSRRKIWEDAN